MEEILTIFDEQGRPVGSASRKDAHRTGLLHQVAHIWVLSRMEGEWWLWFQQRAFTKADFPGLYDTAVGGHIAHGEESLPAAVREMGEEIGLIVRPEQLLYLGDHRDEYRIPGFFDREIARVYIYEDAAPRFAPGEEVEQMVRIRLTDYCRQEEQGGAVSAVTAAGETITIPADGWCKHPGEFRALVLPWLNAQN